MRSAIVTLAGLAFAAWSLAGEPGRPLPKKPGPVPADKAAAAAIGKPANASAGHYWYENGQRKALRIDPAWVADFSSPGRPERGRPRTPLKRFIGGEKALETLPGGASPVFRDANGAARALGGGVIVRLRAADLPHARARLADAGLVPVRPLDPEGRTWLVDSPPGLASLALANQLHESGRFETASPNWWRPRALK